MKASEKIGFTHARLAEHDRADLEGLGALTKELRMLEVIVVELEIRWLQISEAVVG